MKLYYAIQSVANFYDGTFDTIRYVSNMGDFIAHYAVISKKPFEFLNVRKYD